MNITAASIDHAHEARVIVRSVKRFLGDEKGLETVEYAVLTSLIVTALVAAIAALGVVIINTIDGTVDRVDDL